jgi:hypothetical protein
MKLTMNQRHLMEHTLGGADPEKWYRNHFMASNGHPDLQALRELESMGLMIDVSPPSFVPDSTLFRVTNKGKAVLNGEDEEDQG